MGEERRYRSKKKKRTGLKVTLFILLAVVVAGGAYLINVYRHVNNATDEIYKPVAEGEVDSIRGSAVTLSSKEPISILLLGIDSGDLGRTEQGRSDSIMIATVNPNTKKTTLMSIPRDTYTEIVGHGTWDKINHAYAFGGTGMSINTVQTMLDIPIDYYVTVNMAGIQEIVDAVDGIDVVSPLTFNYEGYQFYEGQIAHMDGETALAFSRMRYEDSDGDMGRQRRQQLIIEGVIDKVISPSTLFNYQNILGSLSNNVQTNFQMADYLQLQSNDYLAAAGNIVSEQVGGSGSTLDDGIWYYFVPDDELYRIQSLLRTELELD
ncbi:LCP family glycopolymer transferase [Jeotgalibaca ciconiae]|uniref:Transcriptional regulator n=1 Tax=Jeotgalibaca ciconiae TaxID=2496265 RepID=A0A3Q9BL41_9LACT|nr:LCP family protein [Jeotgalibaca ciconiae]AZP04927.1 transcriptional regulator [Jeotgalibaca ciconiae]